MGGGEKHRTTKLYMGGCPARLASHVFPTPPACPNSPKKHSANHVNPRAPEELRLWPKLWHRGPAWLHNRSLDLVERLFDIEVSIRASIDPTCVVLGFPQCGRSSPSNPPPAPTRPIARRAHGRALAPVTRTGGFERGTRAKRHLLPPLAISSDMPQNQVDAFTGRDVLVCSVFGFSH